MKRYWLAIPFLLCSLAVAQEQLVQTGPFGTPVMVADEGGTMRTAIIVYETTDRAYVIPDITSLGWRASFIAGFQQSGKYPIQIYLWYKTTKTCAAWPHSVGSNAQWMQTCADLGFLARTAIIDVHNQTVQSLTNVFVDKDGNDDIRTRQVSPRNTVQKLSTTTKPFQIAIERVTKIVENESKGGRGN